MASRIPMHLAILVAYFLIYVVWGSTYYLIGVALRELSPFLLGAVRFSAAGLILLGLCAAHGERVLSLPLIRRSAMSGIILLFVDMAVIMLAQRYVTSSLVAIMASSTALWILLLDVPRWKQNMHSPLTIGGMLTGFAGVLMLYGEQFTLESAHEGQGTRGMLILILGCISWALGTLYAKYRSSQVEATHAFAGSAWQMIFASAAFWLCTITLEPGSSGQLLIASETTWLALVYLIVCGSILAYSAYVWLLKVRPAAEVATHAYVNPVVAVVIGVCIGHEQVSLLQLTGLCIILAGVILISLNTSTQAP